MADKLQVELDYQVKSGPIGKLEKLIAKSTQNTVKLEKAAIKTSKKLNKMLDDYKKRQEESNKSGMNFVKTLGLMAGATATVMKGMESVRLASDYTETVNKMKVVFGDMSNEAQNWADNYSKSLGFSNLKTKEAMGDIQNLFTGFGMARDTSFDLSKQIVTLANDLDSFNNLSSRGVDVQKTMISALMGESQAAKTVGASILEPQMQLASLALGYGEYSNKMDEATKIQIRLKAIMMQSKDAMGDVERNLDTEVAKRRRNNAEIENTMLILGQKLMPIQMKWLDLQHNLIMASQQSIEFVTGGSTAFKLLAGAVGSTVTVFGIYKGVALTVAAIEKARTIYKATKEIPTIFMSNLAIIKETVALGAQKVATIASLTATKLFTAAQWALNVALNANPISLVITGIAALGAGFVIAYKKIEPFRNLINSIWETLKDSSFVKAVVKVFDLAKGLFGGDTSINTNQTTESRNITEVTNSQIPGFRTGLSNVPYDGMVAKLHEGERVLTKSENKEYNNNSKSNITLQINAGGVLDLQKLVNAVKNTVKKEIENQEKQVLDKLGVI